MNRQTHGHTGFTEATSPEAVEAAPGAGAAVPGADSAVPGAEAATPGVETFAARTEAFPARPAEATDPAEAVDAKGRPLAVAPARVPWLELGIFVLIAFALAWLVCLPLWVTGQGLSDPLSVQLYGGVMMFTPLIAGFAAFLVQRRRARRRAEALASAPRYFGFWPLRPFGRVIWTTVGAFFGIFVLVAIGYLLSAAFGWLHLDLSGLSGFKAELAAIPGMSALPTAVALGLFLLLMVAGSLSNVFVTIGEEFGWRGWLLTSLRPLGTWPALLIVGAVWGLWHAPLILLGYNFNRPDITGLGLMVLGCVMLGVLFGWLRLRTGSVWPAVFAHAALNGSASILLVLLIDDGAPTPDPALITFLGASGWIVSALVIAVLAATGQFRKHPELGIKESRPRTGEAAVHP